MKLPAILLALLALLCAPGCGDGDSRDERITVFAAASLTDAFGEVAEAFQADSGVRVSFSFAGSPTLRTQLEQGARADLLATADEPNIQSALEAGVVRDRGAVFARNRLAIIVPGDNPGRIATPADLARDGLKLVLAQENVPAGDYARESLGKMAADPAFGEGFDDRVLANVVSEEANVKAIVTKVQLGEADAGIVYATDVTPGISGDVTAVEIPDAYNIVAMCPIAVTADAANLEGAETFVEFLLSSEGQAILERHGFLRAP